MCNLIKADFYKIHRSMIYKVLFLLMAVCAAVSTLVSHLIGTGDMDIAAAASTALLTDVVMLNLVGAVIAGQLICGDFENKLVQSAVAGCCGRFTLVVSKMVTYTLLNAVMSLPYAICAFVGFVSGAKFGPALSASSYLRILAETGSVDATAEAILKYLIVLAVIPLIYTAQNSMVFLLAFVMRSKALVVTVVGFLFCILFGMTSSLVSSHSETVEKLISWTPFSPDACALCNAATSGTILKMLGISLVTVICMTLITYASFRKSEIK